MADTIRLRTVQPVDEEQQAEPRPVDDFKPKPVFVKLGKPGEEQDYELLYDLNAFCTMETMYPSVDYVIQMLMGAPSPDLNKVTYNEAPVNAAEIMVDGTPLPDYIAKLDTRTQVKYKDTLNLLWLGVLHNHTEYDADGEVSKYTIARSTLGKMVTLVNLREVNQKIMTAILRDLLPALVAARKNELPQEAEAPENPEA